MCLSLSRGMSTSLKPIWRLLKAMEKQTRNENGFYSTDLTINLDNSGAPNLAGEMPVTTTLSG